MTQKENKKNTVAKSTFYFMKVPFTLSHLTLMTMQHSIVTPFTDEGMKLKESKHRQEVPTLCFARLPLWCWLGLSAPSFISLFFSMGLGRKFLNL